MDHLLGSTSSRRGSRGFFLQLKQITDSESLFTALQSLTGTFYSTGSPWRARAVRAHHSSRRRVASEGKGLRIINKKETFIDSSTKVSRVFQRQRRSCTFKLQSISGHMDFTRCRVFFRFLRESRVGCSRLTMVRGTVDVSTLELST